MFYCILKGVPDGVNINLYTTGYFFSFKTNFGLKCVLIKYNHFCYTGWIQCVLSIVDAEGLVL